MKKAVAKIDNMPVVKDHIICSHIINQRQPSQACQRWIKVIWIGVNLMAPQISPVSDAAEGEASMVLTQNSED